MEYSRSAVVKQAKAWLGRKESNGSHKKIIDVYNSHKPLARGYEVKYTDAWCATFVSAVAIALGYTKIIPTECGCDKMIALFKKMGTWNESDSRTPAAGDIIFYDWQDSGKGDNRGSSDHVGIVEKVSGGTITVIEGNYSNAVKRRKLKVNGRYIRGYGVPKYTDGSAPVSPTVKNVTAAAVAKSFNKSLAGTYKVNTKSGSLNVRHGAGTSNKKMVAIPKGTEVKNYGYYTTSLGVKWLYVQFTYKGVQYTGFCSGKYLKRI